MGAGQIHVNRIIGSKKDAQVAPPLWLGNHLRLAKRDARDVPAVVRHVCGATDSLSLHWVGHSMGGMLAYAALEHFDNGLFRSVTTIGAPGFTAVKHPLVDWLYSIRFLLAVFPWVPLRRLGQLGALFPRATMYSAGKLLANTEHMRRRHVRRLSRRALGDLPAPLIRQFAGWYGSPHGFARADGLFDYSRNLDRISAPLLLIAGAADALTPAEDIGAVFDAVSSEEKQLLICGRQTGFSLDYGHIDVVVGTRARRELYPHISAWIEAR